MPDNIEEIQKDICSGRLNKIKVWTDFDQDSDVVNLWLENDLSKEGSTIMIEMRRNEAIFLAKSLLAMSEPNAL